MPHYEPIHTEEFEGFEIEFSAAPEDTNPADSFEFEEDIEMVRSGACEWFVARVTASKSGIILGEDYLGGCAYANVCDFLEGGYFEDMRAEAVRLARENLTKLNA